jgi:ABC-type branched-subunit amino acid transport system ATPase component
LAIDKLNLKEVEASYQRGVKILQSISLDVSRQDIICLIGPNGAGKSTVLKAIMGLVNVEKGRISLNGEDITNSKANQTMRKGISYVPQGRTVFPEMTVWENLRMGGFILKDKNKVEGRIEQVYEMFPVLKHSHNRKAYTLSGGEQQMLEMGRVLILDPKYMLIDEPSLGLAPKIRKMIFEKIKALRVWKWRILVMYWIWGGFDSEEVGWNCWKTRESANSIWEEVMLKREMCLRSRRVLPHCYNEGRV